MSGQAPIPIAYQPRANNFMSLSRDLSQAEKAPQSVPYEHGEHVHHNHRCARKLRMATLISLGLTALGLCTFLLTNYLDAAGGELGGSFSFWRRATASGNYDNGTGDNQSPFVHNKLWIIVLVLGLAVCLILGVMLSAWCCKGAFNNPLCCPCYLCACCGGLACLECISCGLCADLANQ